MNLLAEIYSQNEIIPSGTATLISNGRQKFDLNDTFGVDIQSDTMTLPDNPYLLSTLAPRLWPFMRHNIRTVRFSAIRTLVILFNIFINLVVYELFHSVHSGKIYIQLYTAI